MRLARVEVDGTPRDALVEGNDLHLVTGSPLSRNMEPTGERLPLADARLLTPCVPSKIVAVGRNYAAHADEVGLVRGAIPSVFLKPPTSLLAPGGEVVLPDGIGAVEHEAELALVIGRPGRNIRPQDALEHVLGYTIADDVSARDLQRSDPHITRAKGFDTFCPLGPWIETDVDPSDLALTCRVDGRLRQFGRTSQMIFDIVQILVFTSSWTTLLPGDVVLTGSPGGTGPLSPGDIVEIELEGVGLLRHGVRAT